MIRSNFGGAAAIAFGIVLTAVSIPGGAQAAGPKSPDWFLQGSAPPDDLARADAIARAADPKDPLTACAGDIPKLCPDLPRPGQRSCLTKQTAKLSGQCREALASAPPPSSLGVPPCVDSTVCSPVPARRHSQRPAARRVETDDGLQIRLSLRLAGGRRWRAGRGVRSATAISGPISAARSAGPPCSSSTATAKSS